MKSFACMSACWNLNHIFFKKQGNKTGYGPNKPGELFPASPGCLPFHPDIFSFLPFSWLLQCQLLLLCRTWFPIVSPTPSEGQTFSIYADSQTWFLYSHLKIYCLKFSSFHYGYYSSLPATSGLGFNHQTSANTPLPSLDFKGRGSSTLWD